MAPIEVTAVIWPAWASTIGSAASGAAKWVSQYGCFSSAPTAETSTPGNPSLRRTWKTVWSIDTNGCKVALRSFLTPRGCKRPCDGWRS